MMLTQKPTSAFRPHPHHRRLPSAPSLAVQPTKTPGLLTLARVPPTQRKSPPKRQQQHQRSVRPSASQPAENSAFPICDDVSEIGDTPRLASKPLPSTSEPALAAAPEVASPVPSPAKQRRGKNRPTAGIIPFPAIVGDLSAPKTAPLSSSNSAPFFSTPPPKKEKRTKVQSTRSPSPKKKVKKERKHRRAPSEGVFHMSSASSAEESDIDPPSSDELNQLLAQMQVPTSSPSTPVRPTAARAFSGVKAPRPRPVSASALPGTSSSAPLPGFVKGNKRDEKFIKFAGSGFQNSPSPDDLPAPDMF